MYVSNYQPMMSAWNIAGQSGLSNFNQQQALVQQAQSQALVQQALAQSGLLSHPIINYSFAPTGQAFQSGISGFGGINAASWAFNPMQQSGMTPWNFSAQQAQIQALAQQQLAQQMGPWAQSALGYAYSPSAFLGQTGFNAIQSSTGIVQPRVELAETNNDVVVTCELPNINANDLLLSVADDSLTISGSTNVAGNFTSIHRTIALPTTVRSEQCDASYSSGMLQVRLPKSDMTTRRRIKVNTLG